MDSHATTGHAATATAIVEAWRGIAWLEIQLDINFSPTVLRGWGPGQACCGEAAD